MKRSLIDKNIDWAIALCEKMHVALPGFAYWTPQDWEDKKDSTAYMRKVAMGWDVTDYNSGDLTRSAACCSRSATVSRTSRKPAEYTARSS